MIGLYDFFPDLTPADIGLIALGALIIGFVTYIMEGSNDDETDDHDGDED